MAKNKSKNLIQGKKELLPFSRLLERAGRLQFKKVYQPTGGSVLMSLDIENALKPFSLDNWYFHICFARTSGDDHEHDHFLLNIDQAKKVHSFLGKLLELHGSVKMKSRKGKD